MQFTLGTPLLDGCVLAVLNRRDVYGYALTQEIKDVVPISESTLYPVLRRLMKESCLQTYDQPYQGRNRRYYTITDEGRQRYRDILEAWEEYKGQIDQLFSEEASHDN